MFNSSVRLTEQSVTVGSVTLRFYCTLLGLNPVDCYIDILVISTTIGYGGSVVSALASRAKGGFNSQLWHKFVFFHKYFSIFPFLQTIHQFGQTIR